MRIWVIGSFLLVAFFDVSLGFTLEGSPRSYVRYPKWAHAFENLLTFDFKTDQPFALLFYTDDGGIGGNFYEISISAGRLRLDFRIGTDRRPQTTTIHIDDVVANDGLWHHVQLFQAWENVKLQMDEAVRFRTLNQQNFVFGDFRTISDVFVGGLPADLDATDLSNPMSKQQRHLAGSVRNLVYRLFPQGVTSPHLLDSEGMRQTDDDYCYNTAFCANRGVCYSTNDGPQCDCAFTDFNGPRCEEELEQSEASFFGEEWLAYDFMDTSGNGLRSRDENITLRFKTLRPDGLLFYAGDQSNYLHLALDDGAVVATANLDGSQTRSIRLVPLPQVDDPSYRFNDDQWHTVVLHRRLSLMMLSVDAIHQDVKQMAKNVEWLSNVFAYVGGVNKRRLGQPSLLSTNFQGCLSRVQYTADGHVIDFLKMAAQGSSRSIIEVHGSVTFSCRDQSSAPEPLSFNDGNAYIRLPKWNSPASGSLSFQFRTNEPDGLLLYHGSHDISLNRTADYFAFELVDGQLYFVLDLGSGPLRLQASTTRVNEGSIWHSAAMIRVGRTGSVTIDSTKTDFSTPGSAAQLDLGGDLFVGGVPWPSALTAAPSQLNIPTTVWSAALRIGYVGCLKNLRLNGLAVNLADQAAQQKNAQGISVGCPDPSKEHCASAPCTNYGRCEEGYGTFKCDCARTHKEGPTCAKDPLVLKVSPNDQPLLITLPRTAHSGAENVQVKFRTSLTDNAILLSTGSVNTYDRLQLILRKGKLELIFNFGMGEHTFHWGHELNDNRWHTVRVKRRGSKLLLFLDGKWDHLHHLPAVETELSYDSIAAGGSADQIGNEIGQSSPSTDDVIPFVGELAGVVFNGIDILRATKSGVSSGVTPAIEADTRNRTARRHTVSFSTLDAYALLPDSLLTTGSLLRIYFQFRTLQADGLLMFSRGASRDFFALELSGGRLKYTFNTGDGVETLTSAPDYRLDDFKWHTVLVYQRTDDSHYLIVDDATTHLNFELTRTKQINLRGSIFVGGMPPAEFNRLSARIASRHGYRGCLSSVEIARTEIDLLSDSTMLVGIDKGCKGPSLRCEKGVCQHGGICNQEWESISCDCSMTTYAGEKCQLPGTSYSFGPRPGVIIYEYPAAHRPSTEKDSIVIGFKTRHPNGILLSVQCSVDGDYLLITLEQGSAHIRYNLGSFDHHVSELGVRVDDGKYHVLRFDRSEANSSVRLDDRPPKFHAPSDERQLFTLNMQYRISLGGRPTESEHHRSSSLRLRLRHRLRRTSPGLVGRTLIERPFIGVMTGVNYNGLRLLDLHAQGDSRIRQLGDVAIVNVAPSDWLEPLPAIDPESGADEATGGLRDRMMSSSSSYPRQSQQDDLIGQDGSGGCTPTLDDEDCVLIEPSNSDLITPVVTTFRPTFAPREQPATFVIEEEEGDEESSGDIIGSERPDQGERFPDSSLRPDSDRGGENSGDPNWTDLSKKFTVVSTARTTTTPATTTTTSTTTTTTSTTSTTTTTPTTTTTTSTTTTTPPTTTSTTSTTTSTSTTTTTSLALTTTTPPPTTTTTVTTTPCPPTPPSTTPTTTTTSTSTNTPPTIPVTSSSSRSTSVVFVTSVWLSGERGGLDQVAHSTPRSGTNIIVGPSAPPHSTSRTRETTSATTKIEPTTVEPEKVTESTVYRGPTPTTKPIAAVRPTTPMGSGQLSTTTPMSGGGGVTKASDADFPRTYLISCVSVGVIVFVILVVFCVFKCYSRGGKSSDSYSMDSGGGGGKAYAPLAPSGGNVAPGEEPPYAPTRVTQVNGYQPLKVANGKRKKDFKEWYV